MTIKKTYKLFIGGWTFLAAAILIVASILLIKIAKSATKPPAYKTRPV
ncbi:hypothetical protein OAF44_03880 [Akkermansiaceae bacterium]|nr:hypothetical protein [Akkermansiaceae bacterium]